MGKHAAQRKSEAAQQEPGREGARGEAEEMRQRPLLSPFWARAGRGTAGGAVLLEDEWESDVCVPAVGAGREGSRQQVLCNGGQRHPADVLRVLPCLRPRHQRVGQPVQVRHPAGSPGNTQAQRDHTDSWRQRAQCSVQAVQASIQSGGGRLLAQRAWQPGGVVRVGAYKGTGSRNVCPGWLAGRQRGRQAGR